MVDVAASELNDLLAKGRLLTLLDFGALVSCAATTAEVPLVILEFLIESPNEKIPLADGFVGLAEETGSDVANIFTDF